MKKQLIKVFFSLIIVASITGCSINNKIPNENEDVVTELNLSNSKELIGSGIIGLSTDLFGGMYRFQGSKYGEVQDDNNAKYYWGVDHHNYICFGTNSKEDCLNDINRYLYRILAVSEDGTLKLIKETTLVKKYEDVAWRKDVQQDKWSDKNTNVLYENSNIFKILNGDGFLNDNHYFDEKWEKLIKTVNWKYGNLDYTEGGCINLDNYDGDCLKKAEDNWTDSVDAKIGLIYPSDYYYSLSTSVYGLEKNDAELYYFENSWISHNLTSLWTIASYSSDIKSSDNCDVWIIDGYSKGTGMLTTRGCKYATGYKPVFYTDGFVTFESGSGKNDNPFIIKID